MKYVTCWEFGALILYLLIRKARESSECNGNGKYEHDHVIHMIGGSCFTAQNNKSRRVNAVP
jgi:hypothetical protein